MPIIGKSLSKGFIEAKVNVMLTWKADCPVKEEEVNMCRGGTLLWRTDIRMQKKLKHIS